MATAVASYTLQPGKRAAGPAQTIITPMEAALLQRSTLTFYASPRRTLVHAGGIMNAANVDTEEYAAPVDAGYLPTRQNTSDYNALPYFAYGSADPCGAVQSISGKLPFSGSFSGWTAAVIGRRAENVAGVSFGIQGNGGGALGFLHRSDNLLQVRTYNGSGVAASIVGIGTINLDTTGPTGDSLGTGVDRRFIVSWDRNTSTLYIWVNGGLAYQGTPTLGLTESSITLGKAYDTNYGSMGGSNLANSDGNGVRHYHVMTFAESAINPVNNGLVLKDWINTMHLELTTQP